MDIDWIKELKNYLRINTTPAVDEYKLAVNYLIGLSKNIPGLLYRVFIPNKFPILIITRPGKSTKSILLHSHIDIGSVGLNTDKWKHDPFSGTYVEEEDAIYGMGSQSMKSQSIQYFAVLSKIQDPDKTIHLSFTTRHEDSGFHKFSQSAEFKELDIQFVLCEGCVSPTNKFLVFYTERTLWEFNLTITTPPGNSSVPIYNTCEIKLRKLMNCIADFRVRDAEKNLDKKNKRIGERTTINLIKIETIRYDEILPNKIIATFQMFIGKYTSEEYIMNEIRNWARKTNNDLPNDETDSITLNWIKKFEKTPITDIKNEMCEKFFNALMNQNSAFSLTIGPGYSDASYFRLLGYPVLGFTPINETPILINSNNEYIKKTQFIDNINLLTNIVRDLTF